VLSSALLPPDIVDIGQARFSISRKSLVLTASRRLASFFSSAGSLREASSKDCMPAGVYSIITSGIKVGVNSLLMTHGVSRVKRRTKTQ
jgi:hypothetical protein